MCHLRAVFPYYFSVSMIYPMIQVILKSFTRLGHLPEDTGALDHSKGKVQRWKLRPWLVFQLSPKCVC